MKDFVKLGSVLNVTCFEKNAITYTKLQHITCINTNPNAKEVAIELDT